MKKLSLILFLFTCIFLTGQAQVKVQFNTINGYGNNLYIDNVTIGNRFNVDAAVAGILNIKADTSFAIGSASFIVAPQAAVINLGRNNINSQFTVTMTVSPGGYQSNRNVASLASGQSTVLTFDNLTITPGQAINITVTLNLSGDENSTNNTLNQYTLYLPGFQRNVLLEEWTSSTCGPCAANNPTIDAFIDARFDSLVAIKYHMNWPSPGNDPMYLYNPDQANDRRFYYGVNAVPHVIMDGIVNPSYPYSNPPSLPSAFYPRKNVGTPVSLSVTNTRLPGDTIQADVTLQISTQLPAGQYYLRVHAIERHIHYNSAPGTNGETDFYDVFRRAYPNSTGTAIPTAPGTYNFTFKYPLDMAVWVDSMIYTAVFVQNDANKEVLNAAKSRNYLDGTIINNSFDQPLVNKPVVAFDFIESSRNFLIENPQSVLSNFFYYELFDGVFPSQGWTINNPDGGITFAQFEGANGPSLGGTKSVKMDFYSYSATNQNDFLYSPSYAGLNEVDSLKFDWAYAQYSSAYVDRLIVKVSLDGGATYPHTVFDKSGAQLATAPTTTSAFVPNSSQWSTFSYPLAQIVPVELTSFTAKANGLDVELKWNTATEVNNYGFEIQRKSDEDFITVGFVKGIGSTTEPQNYYFTDKELNEGTFIYRLKQIDYSGAYHFSDEIEVDVTGPKVFFIEQNYPNPFNPSTKIRFNLAVNSKVSLKIFNLIGEEVAELVNDRMNAGRQEVEFNGINLNSGVYIYKIEAIGEDGSSFISAKKMTLVK
ncbi:T9SS type A sorting domain-containing protein [Ignavibacterium sp.]|uniref:Omp28-related outer membrane protein n=1 Tax=Ignavibacterium sp. TaxID=2651167 RepID=UPI00307D90D0